MEVLPNLVFDKPGKALLHLGLIVYKEQKNRGIRIWLSSVENPKPGIFSGPVH